MAFDSTLDDSPFVVTPRGRRLDTHVASELRDTLAQLIAAGRRRLIVNLEHVQVIDSSGLGVFVTAYRLLGDRGTMQVCGLAEPVRAMFELTRLDRVIEIVKIPAEAHQ